MKPIQIIGFTPLGVILAERLTYSQNNISKTYSDIYLIEQISSLSIDDHWQSVSLFCLINLLKQCRILLSDNSKKFGINIKNIHMNEQLVYSYIKLATECVQKYYLNLLKKRQVKFESFDDQIENNEHVKESSLNKQIYQSYFSSLKSNNHENYITYMTYSHSCYSQFDQTLRLNAFHTIFQYLLSYPTVKLIGPDIFSFEFAYLLYSLGYNQIYLYRMYPNETSLIPISKTNTNLVTLFQIFFKSIHKSIIQTNSNENHRTMLYIIEQFHQFKMNLDADGQLEYEKYIQPIMPMTRTSVEIKKSKRTYLETFRQQNQGELFTKFSTSNNKISTIEDTPINHEEESSDDYFPPSSTFFVLTDINTPSNLTIPSKIPFPNAIRTFYSTPSSLIQNIYQTLRTISNDETIPDLTNIFLSVDHELCVIQNHTIIKNDEFGKDEIFQSQQHDLQRPIENLHDLHKIIQRPINSSGQLTLYESQLFENDALDLQSLLLIFNPQKEIPKNELIFLFHNEYDWHNLLVLPNHLI
ncbi:unnamed protein product [Adineta steineri]|uniref:Uncharacterized protein n=1 Tax=Adineta steineri TaxID=433720 RepID=A0A818R2U8_9BILA|nr:unnamed protein product [Adineta steineri]CAF3651024.1 unnamed protein product [Adineta steineri]